MMIGLSYFEINRFMIGQVTPQTLCAISLLGGKIMAEDIKSVPLTCIKLNQQSQGKLKLARGNR